MQEEITMQHNVSTVKQLAKMQYNSFSARSRFLGIAIAIFLMALGFGLIFNIGKPIRYFFLAAGCILIANIGVSAEFRAEKTLTAIRKQGDEFPCTNMLFKEKEIQITEKDCSPHFLPYSGIIRLTEDKDYYYLFISSEAAYMVPKDQIKDDINFRINLETRTKRTIQKPVSVLSFRLGDLLSLLGKTR